MSKFAKKKRSDAYVKLIKIRPFLALRKYPKGFTTSMAGWC